MAQIELPDRGQPLDISYLSKIAFEINRVADLVSVGSGLSKIKYRDTNTPTQALTSNIIFYAETQKIVDANLSVQPNAPSSFDYSGIFKTTPVVLCSVTSVTGVSNLYPVLSGVTQSSCQVNVFSSATSGAFSADVSIIAIGERISS
jgi:hypothetical protein